MGEKGNLADVRGVGGHVESATQAARSTGVGLGGEALSGAAPPAGGGGGGGGLLSDLADKAGDKITDVGLGRGGAAGIVNKDEEDDDDDA
jgi:hypothetical protein